MIFKPAPCETRWEGVAVCFWIVLIDLLLLVWTWRRPIDWLKYVLILLVLAGLPLLIHLAYRTWLAFMLEYWVDRDVITLRRANVRYVVPLQTVQRVIRGGVTSLQRANLLNWPAPYARQTRALGLVNVTMVANAASARLSVARYGKSDLCRFAQRPGCVFGRNAGTLPFGGCTRFALNTDIRVPLAPYV